MKVGYIMRHPAMGRFSLERMFSAFSGVLSSDISWTVHACPRPGAKPGDLMVNLRSVWGLRADVYHVLGDVQYVVLGLPSERAILTVPDCNMLWRERGLRKALLKAIWYTWPLRRCRLATTISDFTGRDVTTVVPEARTKLRTVHVPVPAYMRQIDKPWPNGMVTVLQVGTHWNKNLERVAEAMRGFPCRLLIVGEPSPLQRGVLAGNAIRYEAKARLSDDEMAQAYADSDLVVFASLYEGFGMPIIEAQATGRPVIAGNVCSMPEVAGEGACLVDPLDVGAIRQAILRVIEDGVYRERLVAQGLENVKRFAPERIAAQYMALYREILG